MRTQTPSQVKWLLVERATIAGDIARLEQRQALIAQEIAERQAKLQALDITIGIIDKRIAPDAAGVIRAFRKEYGRRGALKEFIIEELKRNTDGTTLRVIGQRAVSHFGLSLADNDDFTRFLYCSVKPQLKKLKDEGFAEVVFGLDSSERRGRWRWKETMPTLAELAGLAAAAGP